MRDRRCHSGVPPLFRGRAVFKSFGLMRLRRCFYQRTWLPSPPFFRGRGGEGERGRGEGVVAAADHVVPFSWVNGSHDTLQSCIDARPFEMFTVRVVKKSKRCLTSYFALTSPRLAPSPLSPDGGEGSQENLVGRSTWPNPPNPRKTGTIKLHDLFPGDGFRRTY